MKKLLAEGLTPVAEKAILALAASIRGQRSGGKTSPKKAISSAKNGKLGGRPRKLAAA